MDSEGFKVVARAAGVWPRVGGADRGGGRSASTTTEAMGPIGDKANDTNKAEYGRGKGACPHEPSSILPRALKGSRGKGETLPARPPWADQNDDLDDDEFDYDLFGEEPTAGGDQAGDENMGDDGEDDDNDWTYDEPPEQEDDADLNEMEQEPELEVLRQQWQYKKDVFEAVAWRYWKGQPQYEDAKAQRDQAYEKWLSAKRARATPKLATLHQRKQRALDRAKRKLQKTMQDADEALRLHKEEMARRQEQMRQDPLRIDEAEESLRRVMLQVAASADTKKEADVEVPTNRLEVRNQAAGARRGLESAQAQLQELYDKLEEQGNFIACEQIHALYGSLAGAAGDIEGVEQLLDKPRPQRRPQQAEYYAMDTGAEWKDGSRAPAPPASEEGGSTGSEQKPNQKGAAGTSRNGIRPNGQTKGGGAGESTADPTQAAASSARRNMGNGGTEATPTGGPADAGATSAPAGGGGGAATTIRFGDATTDKQERGRLRADAERALEQARVKFQEAEKGQDTDNAALLYAHQQILTKIGTPSTLAERHAYERWRIELAASLERVAAERLSNEGAYW